MKYSTFAVVTLGCKVNQYEGEALREGFLEQGLSEIEPLDGPDVLVINSCGVTLSSTADSRRWIAKARRANPNVTVVATGCCTDISPGDLAEADVIIPQDRKAHLVHKVLDLQASPPSDYEIGAFTGKTRAFLKVQDGCSRRCSYCAVPIARGKPRSKPVEKAIAEARSLADAGFPEIVLCGVDLGSYGRELVSGADLTTLLCRLLNAVPGTRFRMSSIDVRDVSEDLAKLVTGHPEVCPHLHIPLQSGDAYILKQMRRGYTPDQYLSTVSMLKSMDNAVSFTTDCLVGFPGETEEQFHNTLEICTTVGFSRLHVFPFSARPGTSAWNMKPAVPDDVLKTRVRTLIDEGRSLAAQYREQLVGRAMDTVVENTDGSRSYGLSERYIRTVMEGSYPSGTRLTVSALDTENNIMKVEVSHE